MARLASEIRKLLQARDLASVEAGVEKARAAADRELFGELLDGVTYEPSAVEHRGHHFGVLHGNRLFAGSAPAAGWLEHGLLRLIGIAPDGSHGHRLREQITSLYVTGRVDTHPFPRKKITILSGLRDLPHLGALYLKSWCPETVGLDVLGELGLRVLHLNGYDLELPELMALSRAQRLEELVLDFNASKLGAWPCVLPATLTRFVLARGVTLAGLEPLRPCSKLRVLHVDGLADPSGLERHVELEEVSFGYDAQADLSALSRLPRLRRFSCRRVLPCEELDLSANPALEQLEIGAKELERVAGLSALPRLKKLAFHAPALTTLGDLHPDVVLDELSLGNCPALERLPRLKGSDAVRVLSLDRHVELRSIDGLAGLVHLRELDLSYCAKLTSLAGIEGMSKLRVLVLNDCAALTDVSALEGLRDLRLIAAYGVPIAKSAFPAELRWCVTTARTALSSLERRDLAQRTRPEPAPKRARQPPDLRKIAALVTARDVATIDQGVELLRSLDAPELFDQLLEGVATRACKKDPELSELAPSDRFTGTAPHQPFLNRALLHVVAAAPAGSVGASVREKIDFISAEVCQPGEVIDLTTLARFPKLRALALTGKVELSDRRLVTVRSLTLPAGTVDDLGLLGCMPNLQALSVGAEMDSLRGIELARDLRALSLDSQPQGLKPLSGHPRLRWLKVGSAQVLDGIAHLPALETLDLSWSRTLQDLSPLSDLPALTLLNLSLVGGVANVASLVRLPSLECVVLFRTTVVDFGPLAELPKLRRLCLAEYESWTRPADDLTALPSLRNAPVLEELDLRKRPLETAAPLAGMRALKHVTLTRCKGLRDVTALASIPTLEEIDLGFCEQVTDIDALAELPNLRRVWVRSTGVKKSTVSRKLRDRCDWDARDEDGDRFFRSSQLGWSYSGPDLGV